MTNSKISSKYIFWALLSFLVCALPSVICYHTEKALIAYGYLIGGSCLCFVTFKAVQSSQYRSYVKIIFYLVIILSAIAAVKGIYQYEFLHIDRPKGPFKHPNVFAEHMEIIIPIVIAAILSKQNLYIKIALSGILLLLFGGLIVTLSRGAWLAVTFSIIVMLIIEKNYKALLLACVPAGLAAAARYDSVLVRLRSIFDLQMQSNAERLYGYYSSFTIIKTNPLTGIGFAHFTDVYPQVALPEAKEILPHAHNLVLAYATEAGIVTASAFVVFICLAALYVYTNFSRITNKNHRLLVLGISCGVLSLMLHGLVDYTLRRSSILLVFMFLTGLGLGIVSCYADDKYNKTIAR